ncbi:MAG: alpha-hydroxy-acid oxidizing protein, partial [Proteobacteria bacterium]|nr:alpha-hydroxy-acid oxidizing protein [Pseudomonadota bacterium]
MQEIYETAKQLMKGYCSVCRECNGNACAGEVPGMGGIGTASSFKANVAALKAINFNMRLVHDVVEPDLSAFVLGKHLSLPILAAPIGGVSFNMGGAVSEEDYIKSIIFGCREKGIMG